jgi:tetratricopeptide (TPR) repeat protein
MSTGSEFLPHHYFPDRRDGGRTLVEQAQAAANSGNWSAAEELYEKALDCLRATLGSDHLEVAMALHNLAVVVAEQGREFEARQLNREVTAILMKGIARRKNESIRRILRP